MRWYLLSLTWGAGRGAVLNPFIKKMATQMLKKMKRQCEEEGLKHYLTETSAGVFLRFEGDAGLVEDFEKKDNKAFKQLRKLGIKYSMEEVDE